MGRLNVGDTNQATATTVTVILGPVRFGSTGWKVERLSVRATAGTPQAFVYLNSVDPSNFIAGTNNGQLDTCEFPSPQHVQPGESLIVQWVGATVGSVVSTQLFGDDGL